jgi:hypothetical protein
MDHHIVNLDNSPWSGKGHYHIGCDNRIDYFKHVGVGVLGTTMNISEKIATYYGTNLPPEKLKAATQNE